MKTYALVLNGYISVIVLPYAPDGVEVPIEDRYPAEIVAQLVDITDLDPQPQPNWTYDGSVFTTPTVYAPTPAEILVQNQNNQTNLFNQASQVITPLMVDYTLNDSTDAQTVTLKAWQSYYKALQAVDLTVAEPAWPSTPA
jgi:hypothetical protein